MTTLDELGFYTLTGSAGQPLELLTDAALIPDLLTAALGKHPDPAGIRVVGVDATPSARDRWRVASGSR
jgi:hypothetical protein